MRCGWCHGTNTDDIHQTAVSTTSRLAAVDIWIDCDDCDAITDPDGHVHTDPNWDTVRELVHHLRNGHHDD